MESICMLDNVQSLLSKFEALPYDLGPPQPKKAKFAASSSTASPEPGRVLQSLRQVNDYVFEVCTPPPPRRPSVEMVFFHGLQLDGSQEPHISTWVSRDRSELWLNWISKDFPDVRILTISYDAHAIRTDRHGLTDRYITGENLVHSLTGLSADVGQEGCPVVLVGHCIGGLVIKELCLRAMSMRSLDPSNMPVQNFLQNLKGLFFYATPHHGTRLADMSTGFPKGPLFEDVTTNNKEAARSNEEFRKLRRNYGWRSFGVGEGSAISVGTFHDILVTEASARHDVDEFYTTDGNHFDVCRPHGINSSSFGLLSNFVVSIIKEVPKSDIFSRIHKLLSRVIGPEDVQGESTSIRCFIGTDKARHGAKVDFPDEVVEQQGQVNTVLGKLSDSTPRVAICGVGGIGKTTLAKTLYNKISREFDYTCFVGEVKTLMAGKVTRDILQREVIKHLYTKDRKVDPSFEWSRLQGKRVLIVLDDVDKEYQVKVMTSADGFHSTSRVIVTSRGSDFLIPEDFERYFARELGEEEAEKLFCLHAFKMASAPKDYEDVVMRFVKKCGGLPLGLKVAGRYLYKRPKALWDKALEKLRLAQPLNGDREDGLWSILQMSYDSLAGREREMFLDVATVFHGKNLDQTKEIWRTRDGASADVGWTNLVDKGLVQGVYYYDEYDDIDAEGIQMHEMLRDLGRNIACPDPQDMSGHTRASWHWWSSGSLSLLNKKGKSKVKVLDISVDSETNFGLDIFDEFYELEVLIINDGQLWRPGTRVESQTFPNKLVYLEWEGMESPPPSELCTYENAKENQTLRHLRFTRCMFERLPIPLGSLKALEHLEIRECDLKTLPDSLGDLQALKYLTISWCNDLKALPDSLGALQALEKLSISYCHNLKALPAFLGDLQALKDLTITGCNDLKALPESLGDLQALKYLTIIDCNNLKSLPESLGALQGLEKLSIGHCDNLKALPDSLGDLQALNELTISTCDNLKSLPDSIRALKAQETVTIFQGMSFKAIKWRAFETS